jgi:hypothetical protein
VTIAGLLDTTPAYAAWVVAILIQFVTPRIAALVGTRLDIRPGHFVERLCLLLIGAVGESVVAIGIGIGALVGTLNAVVVTRLRVTAVIATLGMATIVAGVINQRTGGLALVSNIPDGFTSFGSSDWLGVPRPFYALAVVALLGLAACGSNEQPDRAAQGLGEARAGSVAALATCSDWREGSAAERLATIDDLHTYVEGEGGESPALSDEDAYDHIERACAPEYAAKFKLYKVYARGAAFSGFEP